jgi:hypothetical protein
VQVQRSERGQGDAVRGVPALLEGRGLGVQERSGSGCQDDGEKGCGAGGGVVCCRVRGEFGAAWAGGRTGARDVLR